MSLLKVRLRVIFFERAFMYTDVSHWDWAREQPTFPKGGLGSGDCLLFLSRGMNQLLFLWSPTNTEDTQRHGKRTIFRSIRLRIEGGTWNPLMIQNYANEVGLEFVGLRNFREQYTEFLTAKRAEARVAHEEREHSSEEEDRAAAH